jgi:hypothetical protein
MEDPRMNSTLKTLLMGVGFSWLSLLSACAATPLISIDSQGIGSSPTFDIEARRLQLSGEGFTHYKAIHLNADTCKGVSFSGVKRRSLSSDFEFVPSVGSNIVCAIGLHDADGSGPEKPRWQSARLASSSEILVVGELDLSQIALCTDFNRDGTVNSADDQFLLAAWERDGSFDLQPESDLNGDGQVGVEDLALAIEIRRTSPSTPNSELCDIQSCLTSNASFQNLAISSLSSRVRVEFEATPRASGIDGVMMLGNRAGASYSDYAVRVRFSTSNQIQARNGDGLGYQSLNPTSYQPNLSYSFRFDVDLQTQVYSLLVTPSGGSPVEVARNYAFSAASGPLPQLTHLGMTSNVFGGFELCGLRVSEIPTPVDTIPEAPQNLSASLSSQTGAVSLQWSDRSSNEASFQIARVSSTNQTQNFSVAANVTSYVDTLSAAGTYTYSVRAVNGVGPSTSSNSVSLVYNGQPQGTNSGWTTFTPSADSRQIYVSTSGSLSNTGLSASSPTTLADGIARMREGYPDFLYLKKGETYPAIQWRKSGRSAGEKMVITSYGSGARPIIQAASTDQNAFGSTYNGANIRNLALVDLDLRASSNSEGAFQLLGAGANLHFEGNVFRKGGYIQGYNGGRVSNVSFLRNAFLDSNGYSHAQGFYISNTDGIIFRENLFDNNGWISPGNADVKGQGLYIHGSCGRIPAPILEFNIFANSGHGGVQMRPGGRLYGNLGYNNAAHFQIGTTDPHDPDVSRGSPVTGSLEYNFAMESHDALAAGQPKGFAFILDHAQDLVFRENIASQVGGGNYPLFILGDAFNTTILSSISYLWSASLGCGDECMISTAGLDSRYASSATGNPFPNPSRNLGSYASSIGIGSTPQDFLALARQQSRDQWNPQLTAKEAIRYLRAGFGRTSPW